ncbi:unnamed protein product [Linum trigynum]|uniref:Uncharacterized protein n=1 Tax=Linum trigynum TaxID=586398 RepID=A0AAV2DCH6_9ROSI
MSLCKPGFSALLFPSMKIWVSSRKPNAKVQLTDLGVVAKKEGEVAPLLRRKEKPSRRRRGRRSPCRCCLCTQKEEEVRVEEGLLLNIAIDYSSV